MSTTVSRSATDAPPAGRHGVLFDVGYTLLDEAARLHGALRWLAGQQELAGRSEADLHGRYVETCAAPDRGAAPGASLFVQMMTGLGLTADRARGLRRRMEWDGVPLTPYPDTLAVLGRLRAAGLRLGVLANQPASVDQDLRRAGLMPLLDDVWLSEARGLHKPDAAFFELALEGWGLPPGRVAYVGDRPDNDVRPAKALGMHTVLLRVGPHAAQPIRDAAETPDYTARDLTDAADHLVGWARG